MSVHIGGLNPLYQLKTCPACGCMVPAKELRPQDGTQKCSNCMRGHAEREWDKELNETNAQVPVKATFGGRSKRFRQ